jgi:O-antigen/teichoic acid export membrane protein
MPRETSPFRRLLVQSSHYGLTSLFSMIAGLVTFPVLTRLFSVADYGTMNLIAATLTISVAIAKVGVQHSIVRYHSEIEAGKSRYSRVQLYSTTAIGMTATALLVMLALTIFGHFAPSRFIGDPKLRSLFAIASLLVVVQGTESVLTNYLRAEQKTAALMKYQIAKKYTSLACILVAVLLIARTLTAFYWSSVLAETVALVVLTVWALRAADWPRPRSAGFSAPLYKELIRFGIPMMIGYELSGLILSVGDRYVIQGILGEEQLGLYAAAYNLCQYVQALLITSMSQAIMPIYVKMWDTEGVAATSAFINRSLRTYVMFGAPIIAGLSAVGPELLPALASNKYASAELILPWVIGGMVVDGTNAFFGAATFIKRKTVTVMVIVLSGAVLNIALNIVLVPHIGIRGSAIATFACYAYVAVAFAISSRNILPVAIPWRTVVTAGVAALAMYYAVHHIMPGRRLLSVGVRVLIGAPIYTAAMVLISPEARDLVRKALARVRGKALA